MAYCSIPYRNIMMADWCEKCFRSVDGKFWYYFIPKNASSSLREVEYKSGAYFFHHDVKAAKLYNYKDQPKGSKTIIVLREPFDRLVSAYCWDIKHHHFDGNVDDYMLHIDKGYPTPEAVPQIEYIKSRYIKLENIDYVWFTDTLSRQFNEFCAENNLALVLPVVNVSTSYERKGVEKAMRKPRNYEIFLKEYAEDIKLYDLWWNKING